MEVVVPDGVAPPTVLVGRAHDPRIVGRTLDRHECRTSGCVSGCVHGGGQFLHECDRRRVDDGVDGVEAEPVEMEVRDPADSTLDEEPADMIAAGARHVHRVTPRCAVRVGEVGPEPPEDIAFGTHVVVDDVEHHSKTH